MKKLFLIFLIIVIAGYASAAPTVSFFFDPGTGNDTRIVEDDIVRDFSAIFQIVTSEETTCRYSTAQGVSYNSMIGIFDFNFGTIHKKNLFDLEDGVYKHYVRCRNSSGFTSGELEAVFNVITPITSTIALSKDSPIGPGLIEIDVVTSKTAQPTPELFYSFNGIRYDPIPLSGSGTNWNGFIVIPGDLGEVVGSFRFSAKDIEGNIGTGIEEGSVFLVDTDKPVTIVNFEAVGRQGRVDLSWRIDEDDIEKFNIYRSTSPNPRFSDFYKETTGNSFSDTLVETGKTYYYRITAADEAGNEGDLSIEVSATALLTETNNSAAGLDPKLLGMVDSLISTIDFVLSDINEIESSLGSKSEKDEEIFGYLQFQKEFDSVKSELNALRRDVEKFRLQSLTQNELNNKLNSAEVKIATLKKRIPENIVISDERLLTSSTDENDLRNLMLELNLDLESEGERLKKSVEYLESGFSVDAESYNLDVIYLDGTKREILLIRKMISSDPGENFSLAEFIPKEIAGSTSEIDVKKGSYKVLKEDPILEFGNGDTEIIYTVSSHRNLANLDGVKTIPLHKPISIEEKESFLTGAFAFGETGFKGTLGALIAFLILGSLASYFVYLRASNKQLENLKPFNEKIQKARDKIEEKEFDKAKIIYDSISESYKTLSEKKRKSLYPLINSLSRDIHLKYFKERFSEIEEIRIHNHELAGDLFAKISEEYDKMPDDIKKELNFDYEELKNAFSIS